MTALVMNPPKHAKGGKITQGCATEGCGRPARRRPTICDYPLLDSRGEHEWLCVKCSGEWEQAWAEADGDYREFEAHVQPLVEGRGKARVAA